MKKSKYDYLSNRQIDALVAEFLLDWVPMTHKTNGKTLLFPNDTDFEKLIDWREAEPDEERDPDAKTLSRTHSRCFVPSYSTEWVHLSLMYRYLCEDVWSTKDSELLKICEKYFLEVFKSIISTYNCNFGIFNMYHITPRAQCIIALRAMDEMERLQVIKEINKND